MSLRNNIIKSSLHSKSTASHEHKKEVAARELNVIKSPITAGKKAALEILENYTFDTTSHKDLSSQKDIAQKLHQTVKSSDHSTKQATLARIENKAKEMGLYLGEDGNNNDKHNDYYAYSNVYNSSYIYEENLNNNYGYWHETAFNILSKKYNYCHEISQLRLKNLNIKTAPKSIPHTLHYVWLTDQDNPKNLNERYYKIIGGSINKLNEGDNWKINIWTNKNSLTQKDQNFFQKLGADIKDAALLKDYDKFQNYILEHKEDYVSTSDIVRQLAVKQEGGLYFDLDYHLEKNIDTLIDDYDSIFTVEAKEQSKIANAIFASKPDGELINSIIDLLDQNVNTPDSRPDFIQKPLNRVAEIMTKTGPISLTEAIYDQLISGTISEKYIVTSHGVLSNVIKADYAKKEKIIPIVQNNAQDMNGCGSDVMDDLSKYGQHGFDEFRGSWAKDKFFTPYCNTEIKYNNSDDTYTFHTPILSEDYILYS